MFRSLQSLLQVCRLDRLAGSLVPHVQHHTGRQAPLQRDLVDPLRRLPAAGWPVVIRGQKNVYNLNAMTRPEVEALVCQHEGEMCVRFFRRADGTLLTADCPVGLLAAARRRLAGWFAHRLPGEESAGQPPGRR